MSPEKKAMRERWKRERDSIQQDYSKNPSKYRLGWSELPKGILKGTKWSYAALYRPPFNFRKCRNCNYYVTGLGWYVDDAGRERCKLCGRHVVGPQWSLPDAVNQVKRPLLASHCVVFYQKK